VGEIELGPGFGNGARSGRARATALEVTAHLLGFIFFDGAGVGLFLGDADRFQSIQDGVALLFEFTCKIVDSNFAHWSFFVPAWPEIIHSHLAVHISLNRSRVWVQDHYRLKRLMFGEREANSCRSPRCR
jgi:hypothetical protein